MENIKKPGKDVIAECIKPVDLKLEWVQTNHRSPGKAGGVEGDGQVADLPEFLNPYRI